MHTSAGVASVIGVLGIVLMACSGSDNPGSTKAKEIQGGDEPSCILRSLETRDDLQVYKLPTTLTFVQQGYLSELCLVLYQRVSAYRTDEPELPIAAILQESGREELEAKIALHEEKRQHLKTLITLLEGAVLKEPFDEETFWEAWLTERERNRKVTPPLRGQEIRLLLERHKRERGIPGESRKPDE